ncbi:MAG: hypothetical protein J6B81_04260 [Spirochaetaceae bacterium]|nr:hypothetical protein [Spirochaetaceae bacterium]
MSVRRFLSVLFAVLLPSYFYATDWILASEPFSFRSDSDSLQETLYSMSQQLPKLILEDLALVGERNISSKEEYYRQLKVLQANHKTLLTNYNNAVLERDKVLLSQQSQLRKRKTLKEKNLAVDEALLKLQENEAQTAQLLDKIESSGNEIVAKEAVSLWKGNSETLFVLDEKSTLAQKIDSEKINGLLTGSITAFNNYAMVEASITVFPGEISSATATAAGSLSDIVLIAKQLASELKAVVANAGAVELFFEIEPVQAIESAAVIIDGSVISVADIPTQGIAVATGNHGITLEAEGYYDKTFNWNFSEEGSYLITVELEKIETVELALVGEEDAQGQVYVNALPVGTLPVTLEVERGLLLGEFFPSEVQEEVPDSQGQSSAYFTMDLQDFTGLDFVNASLKLQTQDISNRIEKRRRTMYNSYSAFLVSLVPTIFSYGMYVNEHNGWAMGYQEEEKAKVWKGISNGTIALSVGLGINFFVQLGRYIFAVDAVLPEDIKD